MTEGSFFGTVAWLRDPRAHASANFVVGRDGKVQELVPLHDIAWHAGNWAVNERSIGIENELSDGDIAAAEGVIIAADIEVERGERFEDKKVVRVGVQDAIKNPAGVIAKLS